MLMSKEEKQDKIRVMNSRDLLRTYNFYFTNFNPLDEEFSETFKLIEAEILRRCKLEGE